MRTTAPVVAAAALLAAAPLAAQDAPSQERVHVVRPGETLWDIARNYLNDPFLWPEIFRLNADVVEDPARIYPSERLVLPGQAGPVSEGEFAQVQGPADEGPRVRFAERAVQPAVLQGDFYRASFVAAEGEVPLVGRFMEQEFQSVVDNRMPMQVNLYDRLYVRVDPSAVRVGDRLHFLREERRIDRRRRMYQPTGVGTVAALDGETATVVVVGMYDRVAVGDVVIPVEAFPIRGTTRARPVSADLQGKILAFQEARPLQRTESILFLDIGRNAGVAVGDEFEAYEPPTGRRWGTRPELTVARMQVVRVTEGTASVRVMELEQPRIAVGQAVRRVARMP
ncbi:LysM domain-containing protein [Longimicrobium sp.]|uniref:LysM peptidoglycan-binding domain-containing protein n=1 Tax=Longimicrobium sp. TaxID=2029185 RepID=UPI002E34BA1A|nr:LysM domain-containing protein [Longimicrobium sp.]HEX6038461.1 LysM domain-containing protein [Longimicrobium sp.]